MLTFVFEFDFRSLSSGARGEVFEINGDHVAVIFDSVKDKLEDKSEDAKEQDETHSIYWVDSMLLFLPSP
jgi:hypothetical protein